MTSDRQRDLIKSELSKYYGPKFGVYARRDEICVEYQNFDVSPPRYSAAIIQMKFDGRKPLTDRDFDEIKERIGDEFVRHTREPRYSQEARDEYTRAYFALLTAIKGDETQ